MTGNSGGTQTAGLGPNGGNNPINTESTGGTPIDNVTLGPDGILTGEMQDDRDLETIRDLNDQIKNEPDILDKIDLMNERDQIKANWDDRVNGDNAVQDWIANPFGDKGTTIALDHAGDIVTVGKLGVLGIATVACANPACIAAVAGAGGGGLKAVETLTSVLTNAQKNFDKNGGDAKKALLDAGLQQVSDEIIGKVFGGATGEGNEYAAALLTEMTKKLVPGVNTKTGTGSGGASGNTATYDWGPGTVKSSNGAINMK